MWEKYARQIRGTTRIQDDRLMPMLIKQFGNIEIVQPKGQSESKTSKSMFGHQENLLRLLITLLYQEF